MAPAHKTDPHAKNAAHDQHGKNAAHDPHGKNAAHDPHGKNTANDQLSKLRGDSPPEEPKKAACQRECKTCARVYKARYLRRDLKRVKKIFKRKKKKRLPKIPVPECMEFTIPVKVVLVDTVPAPTYDQKRWGLAFVALAYYLIGATVTPLLAYTLSFRWHWTKNTHIFLCTFAYQCLMPCGLLHISKMNGLASVASERHRIGESIAMRLLGTVCGLIGAFIVYHWHPYFIRMLTVHSYAGLLTVGSNLVDISTIVFYLPLKIFKFFKLSEIVKIFHVCTTIFSFVCFSSGVLKPTVITWFPHQHMGYFVIVISEYHTILIIYRLLVDIKHAFQYKHIPPIDINTTQLPCP